MVIPPEPVTDPGPAASLACEQGNLAARVQPAGAVLLPGQLGSITAAIEPLMDRQACGSAVPCRRHWTRGAVPAWFSPHPGYGPAAGSS
jgi:hypothetical protein